MPYEKSNFYCYSEQYPHIYDDLFDTVDLSKHYLFVYDMRPVELWSRTRRSLLPSAFPIDLMLDKKKSAEEKGLIFRLVLEHIYEAPSYRHNCKELVDFISERSGIPTTDMIMMTGAQHQWNDPIRNCMVLCVGDKKLFDQPVPSAYPTHHFISLARFSKKHRVLATRTIWERGLDKFGYCSLGCVRSDCHTTESVRKLLGPYADRFPVLIDGIVGSDDTEVSQNVCIDSRIGSAFVNLTMETSYDYDVVPTHWNLPFMTEKTTKPFLWNQVPVFLAPPKSIPLMREVGYDLFDDLIDHSYDDELDPYKRLVMVIDQLEKMCSQPIEHWQKFRRDNQKRFDMNRFAALELFQNKRYLMNKINIEAAIA